MLISVDPSSGVPVFRQLMEQVRLQIASGTLGPGDELPPTRSLAEELGVNPMTVSKAYNLLEREGFLERRPGRPLVVARLNSAELELERLEVLRERLEPAARAVRLLGLGSDDALQLLRELLIENERET